MVENKCSQHNNPFVIYCFDCVQLICINCISSTHSGHKLIGIDDHVEQLKQKNILMIEEINKSQQHILKLLENEQNNCKELESYYEKQISMVNDRFRELHDHLHIKEMEIKKELRSYNESNHEEYVKFESECQHNIQELDKKLKVLKPELDQEINKIDLINLHSSISKSMSPNNNNNEDGNEKFNKTVEFSKYEFRIDQIEMPKELINLFHLDNSKKTRNIYYLSNLGFASIESSNNSMKILIPIGNENSPPHDEDFNIYLQNNSITNNLHFIFNKNEYCKIFPDSKYGGILKYELKLSNHLNFYSLSSVYDGKDHIYIIGGVDESDKKTNQTNEIIKFNIHSETLEIIENCKFPFKICECFLSYDNDNIHIVGCATSDEWRASIYMYNFTTSTFITVTENAFYTLDNMNEYLSGCWVPKSHSYYFITNNNLYIKRIISWDVDNDNLDNILIIPLPLELQTDDFIYKLMYDDNWLIIISLEGFDKLYKFDIRINQFKADQIDLNTPVSFKNYISLK